MARIRDMMGSFELFQPADVEAAVDLLRRHGEDVWILSGGTDTFDWLKDRGKEPSVVVDLGRIEALRGIRRSDDGGLEIGAMTTLTHLQSHPDIVGRYPLLSKAARKVASPQIRNQGTLGGNVCQDTRCWYYRSGWSCYRAGGNTCFANAPRALNREHAILEGNRCVAVSPSDTAPALLALDARMVIRSHRGEREVAASDFFLTPATDIQRMTVLRPNELLTAIRIPGTWAGKPHYFEKVADRQSWDFALVSISTSVDLEGGLIRDVRIALGGVSPRPIRATAAENFLRGKAPEPSIFEQAGELAIKDARPLNMNEYKIPLTRNLVRKSLREARA